MKTRARYDRRNKLHEETLDTWKGGRKLIVQFREKNKNGEI